MRWRDHCRSDNIEDRRNQPGRMRALFGVGGMRLLLCGKSGLFILVVVLVAGYYGIDLIIFITGGSNINSSQQVNYQPISAKDQQLADFTSVILASTEDVWQKEFSRLGCNYTEPKLVLCRGYILPLLVVMARQSWDRSTCPADQKVYIDLSFEEMKNKLGAGGDFAQGYIVAYIK